MSTTLLLIFLVFSSLLGYAHLATNSSSLVTSSTSESSSQIGVITDDGSEGMETTYEVTSSPFTTTVSATSTPVITTMPITTAMAAASAATAPAPPMKMDHPCLKSEMKYVYTPCDDNDKRWRVQVPRKANCFIKYPDKPEPGIECSFSCKAGTYLDIRSQSCLPCPSGTYSVGDGKRFSRWKKLPEGFETFGYDTKLATSGMPLDGPQEDDQCKYSVWTPQNDYLESNGSSCRSMLKYNVVLEKPGNISFDVRSGDESSFFHVWVENDRSCSRTTYYTDEKIDQYITVTTNWKSYTLTLSKGRNIVYFLAAYFSNSYDAPVSDSTVTSYSSDSERTVMINNIVVRGFSSSYNCDVCEAGTYSLYGASSCVSCQENEYSMAGSRTCIKCHSEEYSAPGSDHCTPRVSCSEKDYYMVWEPCRKGKTRKTFLWKEPHTCSITHSGSVQLPLPSDELDCPACNPGQYNNGTDCVFCPKDHFSSGTDECKLCPPRTRGAPGLHYKFWTRFPISPMHLYCIAKPADGCRTENGWMIHDEYIDSGSGHADDAELLMYLTIPEFTKDESEFKITFSIVCPTDKCRFRIQMIDAGQSIHLIRTYEGNTERTTFRHVRHSTAPTRYRLVFEKKYDTHKQTYYYTDSRIKIFSIDVTNVKGGGTAKCEPCASDGQDCINCPSGSYIGGGVCLPCPKNTYLLNKNNPVGIESCKPCPYGTVSNIGSTYCYSNCHMLVGGDRHYNFAALAGLHVLKGEKRYTTKGYQYYHEFKINLCGTPFNESVCSNKNTAADTGYSVKSAICRSTVIPDNKGHITAQSVSIGKVLESVTTLVKSAEKDNSSSIKRSQTDVIIFAFHSERITEVCKTGTYGIVRLVCDPLVGGKGKIEFGDGDSCLSETCNGCNYTFTMKSKYACPKCTASDYEVIDTACMKGIKKTHYIWKQPHVCFDHGIKPIDTVNECTIFEKSILDFKVIILAFFIGAILLAIIVLYLCYRNRSLSYKYHRLADSSNLAIGEELPASDKCALEEGEDEDDQIVLAREKGRNNIIDRIKGMRKGKKEFSEFETINLDSMAYSDDDEI